MLSKPTKKFVKTTKKIIEAKKTPILTTQRTRSGRKVAHKKLAEDEITDFIEEDATIEPIEEKQSQSPVLLQSHVQIAEDILPPVTTTVEDQHAHHLTEILSVADSFNKLTKIQPDSTDVGNEAIEGTETEALVRECVICRKRMLGKFNLYLNVLLKCRYLNLVLT